MSIFEYDEEKEIKLIREAEFLEGKKSGEKIGQEIGEKIGSVTKSISVIRNKYEKYPASELAEILDFPEESVRDVIELLKRHPDMTDTEIRKRILESH